MNGFKLSAGLGKGRTLATDPFSFRMIVVGSEVAVCHTGKVLIAVDQASVINDPVTNGYSKTFLPTYLMAQLIR